LLPAIVQEETSLGLFILSSRDSIMRLESDRPVLRHFLCTLLFAAASLAGLILLWLARRHQIRRSIRWFSTMVTLALLIAVVYWRTGSLWDTTLGVILLHPRSSDFVPSLCRSGHRVDRGMTQVIHKELPSLILAS
jgi:hypothetical protein